VARVAAGAVFLAFSVGKFTRHDAEAAAFERYGVPAPELATYAVGLLELLGGLALLAGFATRVAALLLALNMVGAVATAGRVEGGPVHLGLAPALRVVMLALVWTGAGALSVDRALTAAPGVSPGRPRRAPS
jgi:putative oxidoreductase